VSAATATGGADRTRRGRPRRTVQPGPGYRWGAGPRAGRAEAGGWPESSPGGLAQGGWHPGGHAQPEVRCRGTQV